MSGDDGHFGQAGDLRGAFAELVRYADVAAVAAAVCIDGGQRELDCEFVGVGASGGRVR